MKILLIDDDANLRKSLRLGIETMGHQVTEARDGAQAQDFLAHGVFDIALLDLRLAREHGLDILPALRKLGPNLAVIVITAYATIETAVAAMRLGAADYLPKPFTPDQLRLVLERVGRLRRLETRVSDLEDLVREAVPEVDLKTEEGAMKQALELAFRAAPSEATVLLRGESGTGKGVLARAIHARSARAAGPFTTVHCPSLSADLLENELFGHVRGAFTGAVRDTWGKVAAAAGGTLFLDEIGDLPLALQPKLLRVLQERCYERVGETQTRPCDVRILAATNRDLATAAESGSFRGDLLYRLNVIELTIPALLERRRDVLPLADHLLGFFAKQIGKAVTGFTPEARGALLRYAWPGNVRELRNAVERGVVLTAGSEVGLADLPAQVGSPGPLKAVELGGAVTLDQIEAEHIRRLLAVTATVDETAAILGVDPSTLYRKRKRYGL
jgi:NtrC-family two-component system response regulator AlgB